MNPNDDNSEAFYDYGDDPFSKPSKQSTDSDRKQLVQKFKKMLKSEAERDGNTICPVEIVGKKIATTFWGKGWIDHLEQHHDYERRLPGGKTLVNSGCVVHLEIESGLIFAKVVDSELWEVHIRVAKLDADKWQNIITSCTSEITSILDLLKGQLSQNVVNIIADRNSGVFPSPGDLKMSCSCVDDVSVCKHVAAALYGVGHRLDTSPELFFTLRSIDQKALIKGTSEHLISEAADVSRGLDADELKDLFGVEFDLN